MASDDNVTYYLDVEEIWRETPAAFFVKVEDVVDGLWLPKSLIRNLTANDLKVGDRNCTVEIPTWLARDKGLT